MDSNDWDFMDNPVLPGYPWPRSLTPRGHPFGRQMAEFLCEVRIQAGMTQADLAGALDTTQPAIAKLESARHLPSVGMLVRIAEATRTPMAIVAALRNPARVTDRVELWPPPGSLGNGTWPLT
jgi:DNA-binding XRE family transcriptional regulator